MRTPSDSGTDDYRLRARFSQVVPDLCHYRPPILEIVSPHGAPWVSETHCTRRSMYGGVHAVNVFWRLFLEGHLLSFCFSGIAHLHAI